MFLCVLLLRGDEQHDQLSIAYHLLLDSRSSDKPKSKLLPTASSSSDLASSATFSMVGGAGEDVDAPGIKKQVRSTTRSVMRCGHVSHSAWLAECVSR